MYVFLSDYPCALQRDILLQGRLYLSENWLCFYSNVFWGTKVRRKRRKLDVHCTHIYVAANMWIKHKKLNGYDLVDLLLLCIEALAIWQSVSIDNADSQRCRHDHQRENCAADSQCHPGLHKHREGVLCKKRRDTGVWSCTENFDIIYNYSACLHSRHQFFFTSFSAREKTYLGVFRMWQNTLLDKVRSDSTTATAYSAVS